MMADLWTVASLLLVLFGFSSKGGTTCPGCRDVLGMEIGAISDSQISASSSYKKPSAHAASQGRLNFQETSDKAGAWVAATNDVNQWLQVDLYQLTKVTRVATQGRNFSSQWPWGSHSQWVTKYNLLYSDDDETFQYYMEQGQTTDKEFDGNTDRNTVVYHDLNPPIMARYIRFRPTAWQGLIAMRVELYGCTVLGCPAGWFGFQDSCYLFSSPAVRELGWEQSRAKCIRYLGDLVSVADKTEMEFINSKASKVVHYWMGLNDQHNESVFVWSDNTPYNSSAYNYWYPGEPNDAGNNEDCVELTNATWNDDMCEKNHSYICKIPKATCPQNWTKIHDSCYWFSSDELGWNEAESSCEAMGSQLTVVNSQAKQWALSRMVSHSMWIGLHRDPNEKSNWLWVDGSHAIFTYWAKEEPNNLGGSGNCTEMAPGIKWNDLNCSKTLHYSCKIPGIPLVADFSSVGCYKDTIYRAIPTLEGKDAILDGPYQKRKQPIVKCAVAAMRAGYGAFAVQNGGWCAASASALETFDTYGKSSDCKDDGEGGFGANQVYSFNDYEYDCFTSPVGVSDTGVIPDSHMSASSTLQDPSRRYQPAFGRLLDDRGGGWCSRTSDGKDDWLQIYFGDIFTICRVDTKGDEYGIGWVTAFKLSFSLDGITWRFYKYPNGTDMEFRRQGNSTTIDQHKLPSPVGTARYIRFHPTDSHNHSCLRVEVYGKKAYYFNTWLILKDRRLTLELLNTTSHSYQTMKTKVENALHQTFKGCYGFLFAEVQRFGAQTKNVTAPYEVLLMADVKVFCMNSAVKFQLLNRLRTSIKLNSSIFDSDYLVEVDTGSCSCPPVTIDLNLSKTLEQAKMVFTADFIEFKAKVNHSICSSSSKGTWHIAKAALKSKIFNLFFPHALTSTPPYWSMWLNSSLESYLYVSYILKLPWTKKVIGYDYGYVLLQPSPVAKISGFFFATKGEGNITLNGSLSYDPQGRPLNFTWFCRRNSETFPENNSLQVVDVPNGNSSVSGGCYGYGPGRLSVVESILVVDVDKLEEGQTYVYKLVVSNGVTSSKALHQLKIMPKTSYTIRCTYNCAPKVIPSERMIIKSNYTGEVCGNITRYHWSLFKRSFAVFNYSWKEVTDLANRTLTGLNNPNLVLAGKLGVNTYSLEKSTTYKINSSVTVQEGDTFRSNEITFETVSPLPVPKRRCFVTPPEGFALETKFTLNCSGWQAQNKNLIYEFSYHTSTGLVIVESGTQIHYISLRLPQGKKSEDYNVTIYVKISDEEGASHLDRLTVKVKPLTKVLNVTEKVNEIEDLLEKGNIHEAASKAIALLYSSEDNATKDALLSSMAKVQVSSISETTQLSVIVVKATQGRDRIPLNTLGDATILLNKTITFLRKNAKDHRDLVAHEIGGNTLRGLSNTLHASTGIAHHQGRKLTERILSLVNSLGSALFSIMTIGQRQSDYKSDTIIMTLKRQEPSKLGGSTLSGGENEGGVTFPSAEVLFGRDGTSSSSIDSQAAIFKENPYEWTNNSRYIKSFVLSVDLKKPDGSRFNISGLSHPVGLFIPGRKPKDAIQNENQDHFFVKPFNDPNAIRYHKILLENDFDIAIVEVIPENNTVFDVFVSAGVKPTPDNFTFKTRIPHLLSCKNDEPGMGNFNCTKSPFTFSLSRDVKGNLGDHFIGIRLANEAEKRTKSSRVTRRSCLDRHGRQKRSCIGVKDPPTSPPPTPRVIKPKFDNRTDVNYTMSVKIKSCLYWSDSKQDWTGEGCMVGLEEMKGELHCLCTHLSAFGGRIFVAPNPIDFKKVFEKSKPPKAFVVLAVVCVIFGVYFIGLVFARRADKKDRKKVVANIYLTDLNTEGYTYDISIQTGMWRGCGTTANVAISINGDQGSSGTISLTDPLVRRKFFSRGSVNVFTLILPSPLGNLTDIRIWHDNTGSSPAWFLQQVVITDQQTEEKWYFFASRWLALDERSGSNELDIEAAKKDSLALFKPLFCARTARGLGEGHIWISVFTRPPQNPFTRCQRLSCCLAFVFTAMVTNAMFYQFDRTPTDTFKFGPLVMSWTQIIIGVQSSAIAFLANFPIIYIFSNLKQTSSTDFYDPGERNKKKNMGCLPPLFIYVAWCLCVLISLTGAAVTVFYSLSWEPDIANEWLTSTLVSLTQDAVIMEPIKVVAMATLLSFLLKKPPEQEHAIGPSFFQSEKAKRCIPKRPKKEELVKEKEISSKQWHMREAVKEVLSFVVFSIILMIVCYGDQHPARYEFTESTSSIFGADFNEVSNRTFLWRWVDDVLLPGLYDVTWYNGQPFEHKEGFISNKQTFMMGMPRLRQLRLNKEKRCRSGLPDVPVNELFPGCLLEYSSASEDRTPFHLPNWLPLKNYSDFQSVSDICPKPWRYRTALQIETSSHDGVKETYDGGGYVADLGYNKETAADVVRELRGNNWVDERTAAVFIEFTLFDPSTCLFCNVRNVYERLPTGQAVTASDVRAVSLYPPLFHEIFQLLFLVAIVAFFVAEMINCFSQKKYFRQVWSWVELLLLVVSFAAVVVSFIKGKYTSLYVKKIQTNPYETFCPDYIIRLLDLETVLLSLAIFVLTLKLLRLIRFNRHICQMQGTLKRSARPILSFSVVFATAVVAFTQFGFLCFGARLANFKSFFESLRMVAQMSVGKEINNEEIHQAYPVLGWMYLFFFLMAMIFILINIFVAILVGAYDEIRKEEGSSFIDAELGMFMSKVFLKKIKDLPGKIRSVVKLMLKKRWRRSLAKIPYRDTKYSDIAASPVESWDRESQDGMEFKTPEGDITVPLASPESSDIENSSDEEDEILADIKTCFTEIRSALKPVNHSAPRRTFVRIKLQREAAYT